jgi:hypothetical protein
MGVTANGGEISARNIAGRGCIFTIELPRVAPFGADVSDAAQLADVAVDTGGAAR